MERIAKFEKVSFGQFMADWSKNFPDCTEDKIKEIYEAIPLPVRATAGSAGYDFCLPDEISLEAGQGMLIPTGIRAKIADGWVLNIYPRSGLGFKFRLQLDNTVGIIDADYYNAANEGHIMVKVTNDGRHGKTLFLERGKGFAQGVFLPFGITVDDEADGERVGGFGSTNV
ncbi:MAG: deoxyuridine 5'-triphosphate nucleotidohydrolase [Oscillospiraceae bacterium]|nr:deoxyuridine 5'-triphosphate nucleotidohydrolase [Oscillospiraceae bacterium]